MQPKVLYIGVYRDGTGYAKAAVNQILAMDCVGIDVVPRFLKLNRNFARIPQRLEELENKSSFGCTHVIQHMLPHQMGYDGDFKCNIAYFDSETYRFGDTSWHRHLNTMDKVWAVNEQMAEACARTKVTKPIQVISHAIDLKSLRAPMGNVNTPPQLQNKFIFYFIAEMNRRKNLGALLQAFHTEFSRTEPVGLLIKTFDGSMTPAQTADETRKFCNEFKAGMKIYQKPEAYITEVVVADYLDDSQMLQLHGMADCFVSTSHGEAWCLPAADAMALGKTPIVSDTGGLREMITQDCGWLVQTNKEPCFGMGGSIADLYPSTDTWDRVDVRALQSAMRKAFSDPILRKKKSISGIKRAQQFSFEAVGNRMKELLN